MTFEELYFALRTLVMRKCLIHSMQHREIEAARQAGDVDRGVEIIEAWDRSRVAVDFRNWLGRIEAGLSEAVRVGRKQGEKMRATAELIAAIHGPPERLDELVDKCRAELILVGTGSGEPEGGRSGRPAKEVSQSRKAAFLALIAETPALASNPQLLAKSLGVSTRTARKYVDDFSKQMTKPQRDVPGE